MDKMVQDIIKLKQDVDKLVDYTAEISHSKLASDDTINK